MKRQCKGTNKRGEPCGANPLKTSDYCLAHSEVARASVGFGGSRAGAMGGRPPVPKPTEVARQLVEAHVAAILRPHFKALGLMLNDDLTMTPLDNGALVFGESKDGDIVISAVEDLGAQIAAAEKLLDRVYGRPKQSTELTGAGGGPMEMAIRRSA
jgi:hypothetical protein